MKTLILLLIALPLFAQTDSTKEISKFFEGRSGTFVLYDKGGEKYFRYNEARSAERFLPASTFKIPNSLIGLESGVIKDADFVIKWDSVKRWNDEWNKDHTLKSAIQNSVVWYYQELARRVGREKMQKYLDDIGYGSCVIGEKIDFFWLDNSLKISADEEVEFLKRFYDYKLPFSKRSVDIVKEIMNEEIYPASRLKFKTGSGQKEDGTWLCWLVGYVEKNKNVYFFAFNIEGKSFEETSSARNKISREVLKFLKVIE
ncbi:MAG: class D beta-lactamase [Ignavibacteriales bacterium]|nr:class D beta-lactamase [Ignavibacteriales bacterium]